MNLGMSRRVGAVVAAVLLVGGLAGCGSDDSPTTKTADTAKYRGNTRSMRSIMNALALVARAALIATTKPLMTKNTSTPQAPTEASQVRQTSSSRSTIFACAAITKKAAKNRRTWTPSNWGARADDCWEFMEKRGAGA